MAITLKRQLKPSQSTEKETTKYVPCPLSPVTVLDGFV
jgi:hypothetical protein